MFLRDFRPVSFESDGKPLVMTDNGIAVDNGVAIVADKKYETGDRKSIISMVSNTFILNSGNESNLFDGDVNSSFELKHDTTKTVNELIYAMTVAQVVTKITLNVSKFNNVPFEIYASNDNLEWTFLTSFIATEIQTSIPLNLSNNNVFKYYKLSSESSPSERGLFHFMDFVVVDRPSLTTNILKTDNGQFNFNSSDLVTFDIHNNGLVEFKIDDITAISFNAERDIDGIASPGNTHFGGYISTNNSIFCGGNVSALDGILQAQTLKLYDNNADGVGVGAWVNISIDGRKLYLDTIEFTGGGAPIDDLTSSSITTYSSEQIRKEIDDFDKIDSYLGAFYKTNDILFDKYIDIDDLLGKVYEGTATTTEIALVDTLDTQLGLLAN